MMTTNPILDALGKGAPNSTAVPALRDVADLLGVDALPATLLAPASRYLELCQRADTPPEPAPFTADDLAASDWTKRLDKAAMSVAATSERARLLQKAREAAAVEFGTACRQALPAAWDTLEDYWAERVDYLAAAGTEPGHETGNEIRARDDEAAAFERAHRAMLATSGANNGSRDYRARYWHRHVWTREQWATLVDSTGPALAEPRGVTIDQLAQRIGATPRLARTWGQAWDDYVAFEEGRQDDAWTAHYAREQAARGNSWAEAREYMGGTSGDETPTRKGGKGAVSVIN